MHLAWLRYCTVDSHRIIGRSYEAAVHERRPRAQRRAERVRATTIAPSMRACTLACLALTAAAVPQDGSPKPKLYVCQGGHCVVNSAGLPLSECEDVCVPPPPPASPNILQLATSVPDLSTLVTALEAGNLTGTLSGPGPFTVFAPTNEAFSALPPATLKSLLDPKNIKQLQAVLEYHVAAGSAVSSKNLKNHERIKTVEGEYVEITLLDGGVFVDRSRVVKADNVASNGVVHIIDKVLQPLGPPPSPAPPGPLPPAPAPGLQDIIDLAESVGDLSFLSVLLGSSGAVRDALSGRGPFTVFAPTNDVFASLPYPYAASLVDPANQTDVQKLLGFHVVPGIYYPEDLTGGLQVKTLEGDPLEVVRFHSQDWQVDGIYIGNPRNSTDRGIRGDVKLTGYHTLPGPINASNGVVYVINGLLVPPGANPIPPRDHVTGNPFEQQNILRGCTNKSCIFSFTNKLGGCCGEVDAAPRMPPGIWNDSSAVVEYVRLTTVFSSTVPKMLPPFEPCLPSKLGCPTYEFLSLGSCTGDEFHQRWVHDGNRSIDWSAGFVNWCRARCRCGGKGDRPCKDVRDDPTKHQYCSLCGPKYNAPIDVQLYHPEGGSSAQCLGV